MQEIDLIFKFLKKNYPVQRLKINKSFKRVIILDDDEKYLLSNTNTTKTLYYKLVNITNTVFYFDNKINEAAVKLFLNIK